VLPVRPAPVAAERTAGGAGVSLLSALGVDVGPRMSSFPSPAELVGAVQGTLLYLGLYGLVLIPFQVLSKRYLIAQKRRQAGGLGLDERASVLMVKYYNARDVVALAADRTIGNFLEYAIVFLPLMWIHAVYVDPTKSLRICVAYTLSRSYYPLVYPRGRLLLLSTVPGYLVILYLLFELTTGVALR
jgi:hypothetical protein